MEEETAPAGGVDWAALDTDLFLLIVEKLDGASTGCAEIACKTWRQVIASSPSVYLRLLQGVAPTEAEQLVNVREAREGMPLLKLCIYCDVASSEGSVSMS